MNVDQESEKFREVLRRSKYGRDAFAVVLDGLDVALVESKGKPVDAHGLLCGIAQFCIHDYGLLAPVVLEEVGIRDTLDVGWIVEDMVASDLLDREKGDSLADFARDREFLRDTIAAGCRAMPGLLWHMK